MPAPILLAPLIIKGICWCGTVIGLGYVCKKGHDAYQQSQKTKRKKYSLKSKSLEEARKENERLNIRNKELDDKLRQSEQREKEIEKQISDIKKELDDPNTSKQREEELRSQLGFLQTQLDEVRRNNKTYRNEITRNNKQRDNNNRIISRVGLNPDDNHWIWEVITIENVMIVGACYVMYKLLKDDK